MLLRAVCDRAEWKYRSVLRLNLFERYAQYRRENARMQTRPKQPRSAGLARLVSQALPYLVCLWLSGTIAKIIRTVVLWEIKKPLPKAETYVIIRKLD